MEYMGMCGSVWNSRSSFVANILQFQVHKEDSTTTEVTKNGDTNKLSLNKLVDTEIGLIRIPHSCFVIFSN